MPEFKYYFNAPPQSKNVPPPSSPVGNNPHLRKSNLKQKFKEYLWKTKSKKYL